MADGHQGRKEKVGSWKKTSNAMQFKVQALHEHSLNPEESSRKKAMRKRRKKRNTEDRIVRGGRWFGGKAFTLYLR